LGTAVVAALRSAGFPVSGPHGRGYSGGDQGRVDAAVLLCVPDDAIATAAAAVLDGPLLGHCSGVSGLDVFGTREGFSVHPLMTVTRDGADFRGVWAAISGSTPRALQTATALADALALRPAALENWAKGGPSALTGPVARGDVRTVERHREVVAGRAPELLELFDALVAATQRLAKIQPTDTDRIGSERIGSAEPQ
jgi:predicted short-subunit dehydrogenase-like oxidoreductase (DUF2520 family)